MRPTRKRSGGDATDNAVRGCQIGGCPERSDASSGSPPLVLQRTAQISAMRAHLAEYGVVAPKGRAHVRSLIEALALVPKQHSSGVKDTMGGISKMGDRYLRHLLVVGATAVVRYTRRKATTVGIWASQLLERKSARLVTVAVTNKVARIAWAVMAREENYRATPSMAQE